MGAGNISAKCKEISLIWQLQIFPTSVAESMNLRTKRLLKLDNLGKESLQNGSESALIGFRLKI